MTFFFVALGIVGAFVIFQLLPAYWVRKDARGSLLQCLKCGHGFIPNFWVSVWMLAISGPFWVFLTDDHRFYLRCPQCKLFSPYHREMHRY